jgi:hypothetical protein
MLRYEGLVDSQEPEGGGGGGGGSTGGGPGNPPPPPPPPGGPPDPPPGPEPNPNPNPGGPPPQVEPGPPPSAIHGVQSSDVTGGVQGSFGQAGTSEFSRRFGTGAGPANWFRNVGRGPASAPGQSRDATTRGGAVLGGGVAPVAPDIPGDGPGGGQDAEWQRFMREVQRQRFGG